MKTRLPALFTLLTMISLLPAATGVPRIDPDYKVGVETWWATHPFNPESPKYQPKIDSPAPIVNVPAGASIQEALDKLPAAGGTLKLAAGTYAPFKIIARSNIHILGVPGAILTGSSTIAVTQLALDYGKYDGAISSHPQLDANYGKDKYKNKNEWEAYNNPIRNFYIKGITFDGQSQTSAPTLSFTSGALCFKRVRDAVVEDCVFQNFNDRKGHGALAWGHEGLNNVWFRNCQFLGTAPFAVYLDGAHGCGLIGSEVKLDKMGSGGILFLTNHDFTDDNNENGKIDREEERSPKYDVIYKNKFTGDTRGSCVAYAGENLLFMGNQISGKVGSVVNNSTGRPWAMASIPYGAYNIRIVGNTLNAADYWLQVSISKDLAEKVQALPPAQRYTIEANKVEGAVKQEVKY